MLKLQILTYNTWKCDGNYPQRLMSIRRQLSLIDFDILLLQEVFKSEDGQYDTLAELIVDSPDMHSLYHPGRKKIRSLDGHDVMSESGLAVVSRYRMKHSGAFRLPVTTDDAERYCQWCVIETGKQELLLVNTHLTHIEEQNCLRKAQFQALISFIRFSKHSLAVIGGDMNISPQQLNTDIDLACVFQLSQPNTLNIGNPQCLDHLYLYSDGSNYARWNEYKLLLDQKQDGFHPSDHKAVYAELILS